MQKDGKTAACLQRERGAKGGGAQYFVSLRGAGLHRAMQLRITTAG